MTGLSRRFVPLLAALISCVFAQHRDLKPAKEPSGQRRLALVIGNSNYKHAGTLRNPGNDAAAVARKLTDLRFDVTRLDDLDSSALERGITSWTERLRAGDHAFFFYAGHGVQIENSNYLIPVDFNARNETDAKFASYNVDRLLQRLEKQETGLNILVIDACRNNPFTKRMRALGGAGLSAMEVGLGTLIVYAAGPGQTADDNPDESHGLFTKFLLRELNTSADILTAFRRVREAVYTESGGKQRPWIHEDLIGTVPVSAGGPTAEPTVVAKVEAPAPGQRDWLREGQILFNRGEYQKAAGIFEEGRRASPENAWLHHAAGVAHLRSGLHAKAIECFNRAIGISPGYAAAYHNRGLAFLAQGRYQQAVADFSWAVESEPNDPTFHVLLGRAHRAMRNYDEAIASYTRAIDLNQSDASAWFGRADALQANGRYRDALNDFDSAIKLNPKMTEALKGRDAVRSALGELGNEPIKKRN